MAEIFNEQRVLGVRLVADGTLMHNGLPVIGIREAGDGVLFSENLRTLGVDVLPSDQAIHNEQPVRGAVLVGDGRALYNGFLVKPVQVISGSLYSAEAEALFARFTTPPLPARKFLINDLAVALDAAGVWSKLDALYVMAAADAQAAQRNWIADQYNLTETAAPTFTADRGYHGDGVASYLSTGFNPATAVGPKFTLNDAYMGIGALDLATAGRAGNSNSRIGWEITPSHYSRLNEVTTSTVAVAADVRSFSMSRALSASYTKRANGADLAVVPNVSSALSSAVFELGKLGGISVMGAGPMTWYAFGSSIDATADAAFHSAISTYLQAVGAA